MLRTQRPKISALLASTILLFADRSAAGLGAQANLQPQVERQSSSLVIQGRITKVQGDLVSVKTPDGYPGRAGAHAQFVTAGPTFTVDVSHARILLPDGQQVDKVPLAVGDRVLVVLTGEGYAPAPGNINHSYSAAIVERLALSDKIVTH